MECDLEKKLEREKILYTAPDSLSPPKPLWVDSDCFGLHFLLANYLFTNFKL